MQPNALNKKEREWQDRSIFDAANDGLIVIDLETCQVVKANPAACKMHGYPGDEFIGLQLATFIHPTSQNIFNEAIRTFHPEAVIEEQVQHLKRDGSRFYGEWRGTAFTYQGRSCLLGIVRDVSKRVQEERLLHQHIEKLNHEQARLLEISKTLVSRLEFQPGVILDQLREIVEFTHAGLFALEDSTLVSLAMRGTPQLEQSAPISLRLQSPDTLAVLFNKHQPSRIADVWSDNPQAILLRSLLEDGAAVLLEGVQSWMWVPLSVRSRLTGGMGIADSRKNHFTAHHADLALKVANQAAIAMTNAELYKHAQALAALEERQRLARNLHDAVNQSLFSAGLIAEVLPRLWERDQQDARRSLEDLRRLTRGAQAEMRALLAELRPSTLTDSSLGDLLQLLGNAFTGRTNIPVAVIVTDDFILPGEVQEALYYVCQEALQNVAKHARASQVEVNLKQEEAIIEMRIYDNGQGFDPTQIPSGHYGLRMMHERAEAAGAQFSITSQPGQGTELTIRWNKTTPKAAL